jgi:anti-sigma regulatory factor (Ser/Thr protein kinase)
MTQTIDTGDARGHYRHEAFFYADHGEFMAGTVGFIRDAVAAEEPILVVLEARKIDELRTELASARERVLFADMATVGANPARIIPAWQDFVGRYAASGVRVRGIGEPIWAARSAAELAECERHEALLNAAFDDPDFWLMCPYDTGSLSPAVLEEAMRNHPYLTTGHATASSTHFPGVDALVAPFDKPLGPVPADARSLGFAEESIGDVRAFVAGFAATTPLAGERAADLALAAHEVAVNAVVHGGARGVVRLWRESDSVVCEVRSPGSITPDPLVDRRQPNPSEERGRGFWIANHLCDLVQVRAIAREVIVRLHVRLP